MSGCFGMAMDLIYRFCRLALYDLDLHEIQTTNHLNAKQNERPVIENLRIITLWCSLMRYNSRGSSDFLCKIDCPQCQVFRFSHLILSVSSGSRCSIKLSISKFCNLRNYFRLKSWFWTGNFWRQLSCKFYLSESFTNQEIEVHFSLASDS